MEEDKYTRCLHHVDASGSSIAGSTLRRFTFRIKP